MAETVTRKLQKVGGGTFTVSVPKEWARAHDLGAGAEVTLYPHTDGSLVVRGTDPDGTPLGSGTIAVEGRAPAAVERALRAAYAVGFQEVTLTGEFTDAQRRAASDLVRSLVGLEVTADGPTQVTVRSMLDTSEVSVAQSMRRLRFTVVSAHRGATTLLAAGEHAGGVEGVRQQREEARRLSAMIGRHFGRSLSDLGEADRLEVPRPTLFDYDAAAGHLERIADEAVAMAEVADRAADQDGGGDDFADLADDVRALVDDAAGAILSGAGVGAVYELFDRHDAVVDRIEAVREDTPATRKPLLGSLSRTAARAEDVAAVALRAAARAEA